MANVYVSGKVKHGCGYVNGSPVSYGSASGFTLKNFSSGDSFDFQSFEYKESDPPSGWKDNLYSAGVIWNRLSNGILVDMHCEYNLPVLSLGDDCDTIPSTITVGGVSYTCRRVTLADYEKYILPHVSSFSLGTPSQNPDFAKNNFEYVMGAMDRVASGSDYYKAYGNSSSMSAVVKAARYYSHGRGGSCTLIAIPSVIDTIDIPNSGFGAKAKPFTVPYTVKFDTAIGVYVGGEKKGTVNATMGSNQFDVTQFDIWDDAGDNVVVKVTLKVEQGGYAPCEDYFTFKRTQSVVEVIGKPQTVDARPKLCSIVTATVVPSNADMTVKVTNNGNDQSPIWEDYAGGQHEFTNKSKQTENWALNWNIQIDAADSPSGTNAEIIGSVGMGVLFDEDDAN